MESSITLDSLTNIQGAHPYPEVYGLFSVLDSYTLSNNTLYHNKSPLYTGREDVAICATENVVERILSNMPSRDENDNLVLS